MSEQGIKVKKVQSLEGWTYSIKCGVVSMNLTKDKAELVCRMLARWLGFELVEKHKVKRFNNEQGERTLQGA